MYKWFLKIYYLRNNISERNMEYKIRRRIGNLEVTYFEYMEDCHHIKLQVNNK